MIYIYIGLFIAGVWLCHLMFMYCYKLGYKYGVDSAYNAVNKQIKQGDLGGNGCDKTAERNGLIHAANMIHQLKI